MKKILILLIIPILLGGCYDYNELGDLAIVSGIGIDYKDDEFEVTFEILSTKKEGEQGSSSSSTYNVTAKGNTVAEAFSKNGNNMDKVPYYDHIKVVVISEDIAKNHLKEISELLIRNSKLRNEFYITIAKNASAKDIISSSSKEKPVAAQFIVDLLEHSNDSSSAGYYAPFTKILRNILTDGEDAIMSTLKLEDDKIILDGMAVFKDFELKYIYNNNEAAVINLLNNFKSRTVFFEKSCGNKKTVMSIYESDIKIEPNNEIIKVSGKLNGRINENNCDYDLKEEKTYQKLQKEFTNVVTDEMNKIINSLQLFESNALSIGKNYYNKYRQKNFYLWTTQDIKFDLDLKINKKGLIFEVK